MTDTQVDENGIKVVNKTVCGSVIEAWRKKQEAEAKAQVAEANRKQVVTSGQWNEDSATFRPQPKLSVSDCRKCGKFMEHGHVCATDPKPESILEEAQRLTTRDRNEQYGHPLDDYCRTAAMFSALIAHKLKEPITAEEMMLGMVCVKLSREMNKPGRDNRTDACGYLNCVDMTIAERERRRLLR